MKYAVVIDAGSSGSRAFVYTWPDPAGYLNSLTEHSVMKEALLPIETLPLWITKRQPGISSFQGRTTEIWKQHLHPLLEQALDVVPQNQQSETPVFFLATAGMRLLPETDQHEIMDSVCSILQQKTKFLVPDCESHVTVIDGETEALYGWLGLNYLVHWSLSEQWNNFDSTYGFLDMGGASAQVAFSISSDSEQSQRHADDLHKLIIRTAGGDPVEWNVFVATWLGFGANRARARYLEQLVSEIGSNEAEEYEHEDVPIPVVDPCMPRGAINTENVGKHHYIFQGSGDFAACELRTYNLLNANVPCEDDPCLFDGVHAPDFDLHDRKFVGVSEYWYTLQDMLGTNGKYDHSTLMPKIEEFCTGEWSNVKEHLHKQDLAKSNGQPFSEDDVKQTCFKSAWVLTMLNKGFNFSLSTENPHLDHKFQDTFQSAMEIDGAEISWTMGRAVLYASAQIPPKKPAPNGKENDKNQDAPAVTIPDVGYYTLKGDFVPGGERVALHDIKEFQENRAGWGTASILFLWTILLLVLGLVVARFQKGSFAEVWDSLNEIRIIRRTRRKFRHFFGVNVYSGTTSNMGYGYSFPHADYPLTDFFGNGGNGEAVSSSRSIGRTPSRVESRISLSDG